VTEPLIAVGRALGGHGIRGEVRVRLDNETSSLLAELDAIYVGGSSGEAAPRQYRLEAARPAPRGWVLRLAGITDRNGADELAGSASSRSAGCRRSPRASTTTGP